jgi:AraC-like DNA-binding protein
MLNTVDINTIELLRDIPDLFPVTRTYFEDWNIKVYNREQSPCKNYLSPNRRDFYKVLLVSKGEGMFTLGTRIYYIQEPTIIFIHPNEIISWKNLSESEESAGHYALFKRRYIDKHPVLKSVIERYELFTDTDKSVIRLDKNTVNTINGLFLQMHREEQEGSSFGEDAMQAYIQLIMIECMKNANFLEPDDITNEFRHIHNFFQLLESEISDINYNKPIKIKSAQEFANALSLHPNYLNALLKVHTGQNVSTHIKTRLPEESKALLLQTDWTLQDIGYTVGFAD